MNKQEQRSIKMVIKRILRYLVLFAIKSQTFHWVSVPFCASYKGDLISEDILTLVLLPKKGAKLLPWAENLNKLFTVKSGKLKLSAQGRDLAPFFFGNGTKVKVFSQNKLPLAYGTFFLVLYTQAEKICLSICTKNNQRPMTFI